MNSLYHKLKNAASPDLNGVLQRPVQRGVACCCGATPIVLERRPDFDFGSRTSRETSHALSYGRASSESNHVPGFCYPSDLSASLSFELLVLHRERLHVEHSLEMKAGH